MIELRKLTATWFDVRIRKSHAIAIHRLSAGPWLGTVMACSYFCRAQPLAVPIPWSHKHGHLNVHRRRWQRFGLVDFGLMAVMAVAMVRRQVRSELPTRYPFDVAASGIRPGRYMQREHVLLQHW